MANANPLFELKINKAIVVYPKDIIAVVKMLQFIKMQLMSQECLK